MPEFTTAYDTEFRRRVKIELYVCDGIHIWYKIFDLTTGEDLGMSRVPYLEDFQ